MGIRVRLTQDVEFWRTGSRLGFADVARAEAILGTDTFLIEDPEPVLDNPGPAAPATAPVAEPEQMPSESEATFFDAVPQPEPAEQEPA